jgi:hypothetical protein
VHAIVKRYFAAFISKLPERCRLGGVVVSGLATGPKGCRFESGQGDGLLRAIKILSTPSSRMGSKAGRSHVVRFYGMQKNSWSPTGMIRLNSHFLRPFPTAPDLSGDGQSALVVKFAVSPSRSCLLIGSHSLSSGDSTTGPRPQCWDGSLTPSQLPIYNLPEWWQWCTDLSTEHMKCVEGDCPSYFYVLNLVRPRCTRSSQKIHFSSQ